jgi:hypothetical protein
MSTNLWVPCRHEKNSRLHFLTLYLSFLTLALVLSLFHTRNAYIPTTTATHLSASPHRMVFMPEPTVPTSAPIKTFEDLLNWKPGQDEYNVAHTPFHPRPAPFARRGGSPTSPSSAEARATPGLRQAGRRDCKVIVCHDMAGGKMTAVTRLAAVVMKPGHCRRCLTDGLTVVSFAPFLLECLRSAKNRLCGRRTTARK